MIMKNILSMALNSIPDEVYAKIILNNIDNSLKEKILENVKSKMTDIELKKLNEIKLRKDRKSHKYVKQSIA